MSSLLSRSNCKLPEDGCWTPRVGSCRFYSANAKTLNNVLLRPLLPSVTFYRPSLCNGRKIKWIPNQTRFLKEKTLIFIITYICCCTHGLLVLPESSLHFYWRIKVRDLSQWKHKFHTYINIEFFPINITHYTNATRVSRLVSRNKR